MDDTSQGPTSSEEAETVITPMPRHTLDDSASSRSGAAAHPPGAVLSLKQAMRRARFDDAERSGVVSDLRAARLGRLEVLYDALRPLVSQIPQDVDCFDIGIMPGANPRLFIDMIGFVEMARDPRIYAFVQDTRHGRVKLAESESVDTIVEAATQYVARRLLERDKALAADAAVYGTIAPRRAEAASDPRPPRPNAVRAPAASLRSSPRGRQNPTFGSVLGAIFAFLIDVLGSIAFFSILAFAGWIVWQSFKH